MFTKFFERHREKSRIAEEKKKIGEEVKACKARRPHGDMPCACAFWDENGDILHGLRLGQPVLLAEALRDLGNFHFNKFF